MTSPSHVDLVVLAVYLLTQEFARTAWDTEDIAIKAFELAPSRFSWRKHPEQINLELVRVSLSDAKKPDKGSLLDGSGKTGWTLTPAGLEWAGKALHTLATADFPRSREMGRGGSIDEQRWRRERERVVGTLAWQKWSKQDGHITGREVQDVFRIDSYADARMRSVKVARLQDLLSGDEQLHAFLVAMSEKLQDQEKSNG